MGFSRQAYWSGLPLQASGLTEFIPFLFTSAVCGQACFLVHLASCIPPAPQQSPWGMVTSLGWKFGEPSFTFGGQKSLMAVTFLVYQYCRRYFHFTALFVYPFPSAFTCTGLMTVPSQFPPSTHLISFSLRWLQAISTFLKQEPLFSLTFINSAPSLTSFLRFGKYVGAM